MPTYVGNLPIQYLFQGVIWEHRILDVQENLVCM